MESAMPRRKIPSPGYFLVVARTGRPGSSLQSCRDHMPKKRKRGRPPKPALRHMMAELRRVGRSFAEIGKHLGVSKQSVHALLKRHGVQIVRRAELLCHGCSRLILKGDPRTWD